MRKILFFIIIKECNYLNLFLFLKFESNDFLYFINDESIKSNKSEIKPEIIELKVEIYNFIKDGFSVLESKLNDLKEFIEEQFEKINKMKEEVQKLNSQINNSSYNEIRDKFKECRKEIEEEIKEMKLDFPVFLDEEPLISVIFTSFDKVIHYSVIGKSKDDFSIIESLLYKKYPKYKNNNNIFVSNGKKIDVKKSLEDNNIKNGDIITLNRK